MPTFRMSGEWLRMPPLNAPIPQSVVHLPVGWTDGHGSHVNLYCGKRREVCSVNAYAVVKPPTVFELLWVIGCYNPVDGSMPYEVARGLHQPGGGADAPTPSVVSSVWQFRPGSVVVPAGHVLGVWAVGGGVNNGSRFTGNWFEMASLVELDSDAGVVPDWSPPPRLAAKGRKAVPPATPELPAFMAAWWEGREKTVTV